jgi:two-component system response regulator AlgR
MKPRLMIVDDEAPARNRLKTLLTDIAADCPHELVGEAADARQALAAIAAARPDILLLDVKMPAMSGIELAAKLANQPGAPAVIFITAFDQHALKAFELHAADYLVKPVRAARLAESIRHACSRRAPAGPPAARRHFSVQERGKVQLVPVADVLYCKAELKYVTLRTSAQSYLIEDSLVSIEEELGAVFVRVHRKALVAREAIVGVERASIAVDGEDEADKAQENWQVILRGIDERLPISRRQWAAVKALLK